MQQQGGRGGVGAAATGNLHPCILGRDKTKRYQAFLDWLTHADAKMAFLSIKDGPQKIAYIRSDAGPELTIFFKKEVRAKFETWNAEPAVIDLLRMSNVVCWSGGGSGTALQGRLGSYQGDRFGKDGPDRRHEGSQLS